MSAKKDAQYFMVNNGVHQLKTPFVHFTRWLHRVLPVSWQRSIRDGAFRKVADGGVIVTAGVTAVLKPRLAARFVTVSRQKEDHRYGAHPRQVIEVLRGCEDAGPDSRNKKLIVFVHGGAWGSGCTWMYRALVDRLAQIGYNVANVGYRVYPDADTNTQVDDLAAAMDWMASNLGLLGFDESPERVKSAHEFAQRAPTHRGILETSEPGVDSRNSEIAGASSGDGARGGSVSAPEVYLMGHSSGSHISLLYLIRREEERRRGASTRSGDSMEKELEVEGLIGLSGVYDVHRHYLFESWRGVHEISPLKASHGGHPHHFFEYSHPFLLGGQPTSASPTPNSVEQKRPERGKTDNAQELRVAESDSRNGTGTEPSNSDTKGKASNVGWGNSGDDASEAGGRKSTEFVPEEKTWLGRRLPRTFLWHGTADATVPFSQTSEFAAALRAIGVPTTTHFAPGGDHVDPVAQLMFGKETEVERAVVAFTTAESAERARRDRQGLDSQWPRSRL